MVREAGPAPGWGSSIPCETDPLRPGRGRRSAGGDGFGVVAGLADGMDQVRQSGVALDSCRRVCQVYLDFSDARD